MRFWMAMILLAVTHTAYAVATNPYPAYVEECKRPALEKLREMAESHQLEVDENTFKVEGIDDRWYNPYKYIWFSIHAKSQNGQETTIQTMMQKNFLPRQDCF